MARKKPNRKAKAKQLPTPQKVPRGQQPVLFMQATPTWRFAKVDLEGPFGWSALEREKLLDIHRKLRDFETMTWSEILVKSKKQNHRIARIDLGKRAQDRLQEIENEDIDMLVSLRLSGEERVWGILDGASLAILWWDPEHQVYPVRKKRT